MRSGIAGEETRDLAVAVSKIQQIYSKDALPDAWKLQDGGMWPRYEVNNGAQIHSAPPP